MKDYSEPVPDDLWRRLEKELEASDSLKFIPWWKRWQAVAASLAVVIACSITGWLIFNDQSKNAQQLAENNPFTIEKETPVLQDEKVVSVEKEATPLAKVFPTDKQVRKNVSLDQDNYVAVGSYVSVPDLDVERNEASSNEENKAKEETVSNPDKEEKRSVVQIHPQNKQRAYTSQAKSKNYLSVKKEEIKRWSMALSGGNFPASYSNTSNNYNSLQVKWDYQNNVQLGMISGQDGRFLTYDESEYKCFSNNLVLLSVKEPKTEYVDVKHKAPITFGLSVRYALDQDWSVESGIFYTMLNSELTSGTEVSYRKEEQRLHYIGIPLKLNRIIWENKLFDVYASAGGAVEKCVKGKLEVKSIYGEETNNSRIQNVDIDKLQWSVNTSIGVQYKLTKELALYVEPGVVHYFDDGTDVQTIRKKHPTNFNLSVGFRLNLGK